MQNINLGGAGDAAAPPESPPGPGADYTFDMNAAVLFSANQGPVTTSSVGVDLAAGSYAPDGNFADFNGCPINGTWTVEVLDNFNLDDGTLFTWSIDFAPVDDADLQLASFTNTYPTQVWSGNGVSGTTATVSTAGTETYTLTATDDYGCVYSETVDVTFSTAPPCAVCNANNGTFMITPNNP